MVTASNGVKVLAGGINAVGVITATSFTGSGANLTGIDALPSVSGTASGSLTANKAVMLKTDGTYEAIVGIIQNMGTTRTFFDRYWVIAGAYNPDLSNFALLYQDAANNSYTTSVVGSISGNAVTFGTPQVAKAESPSNYAMAMNYDTVYDVYVGFTRTAGASNSMIRVLIGTASGTSITWNDTIGNTTFTGASNAMFYNSCYNPTAQRHALVYLNNAQSGAISMGELSLTSSSALSYNQSDYVWSNSGYNFPCIVYDSTNNCYLVAATKQNNSWYGQVRVINSNQLQSPPGSQWDKGAGYIPRGMEHDPNAGQTCVLWQNINNGNIFLQSTTSVNTSSGYIGSGTQVQLNSGNPDGGTFKGATLTYDSNAKKFVITYCYATGTWVITASVNSAGVITKDAIMTLNAGSVYSGDDYTVMVNLFDPNTNKVATVYRDEPNNIGNGTYAGFAKVATPGYSNLVADKYIGFAAESVTNGQTVKVKTKSNTVTQAGLTTSSRYYVQDSDGSLGTTAAAGQSIDVGIALNSNTVLLQ